MARNEDRRRVNKKVVQERRRVERRKECPECHSPLVNQSVQTATGTKYILACSRCEWTASSSQTDAAVLVAKKTWDLVVEKRGPHHYIALPHELLQALGLGEGDGLVLKPLTLPVGSLPMSWSLSVRPKK